MSFSCALYACQLKRTKGQEKFEDINGKEQTPQWPKEKVQKDKQRSANHYIEN